MTTETKPMVGAEIPRIDGPLKVTGQAMYTSDYNFPGLLYAVPVCAMVANGRVLSIDTSAAAAVPGVQIVFHRDNIGKIYRVAPGGGTQDETRPPLEDDIVNYWGQYVALVVAETFEQAQEASYLVRVTYSSEPPNMDEHLSTDEPKEESKRGDPEAAFDSSAVQVDETYITPTETHCAIELHATVAVWDGTGFTLYETTQGVNNHRRVMQQVLGVPIENVRVISKFLGSGFGSKLFPWPHCALAAMAARDLERPVKLVLTRKMNFESAGHRPVTQQRVRMSATADGKLTALMHDYVNHTSMNEDYGENCGEATPYLYGVENLRVTSGNAKRNLGTPTAMRGPGAVPGLFATESAYDELAVALKMDPVELRLANEPEIDQDENVPFSSRHLRECLAIGAERFGWSRRNAAIGSMRDGDEILGWGMACCSWIAGRFEADATVELLDDGTARVACGTQDIGTGTYTVFAQILSDRIGVPVDKINVVLGDSALPVGPLSGGSLATSSVIPAIEKAAENAATQLLKATVQAGSSPFHGKQAEDLEFSAGRIRAKNGDSIAFDELLSKANLRTVSGKAHSESSWSDKKTSKHSYGAHFLEIGWNPDLARLRVKRVVTVIDAGKIINPLMARNQVEGSIVMGIGMGIFEETIYDPRNGAPINSNLADYIVAVNADTPPMDVIFLNYPDKEVNELGARGVGEIGLAGLAAAICNAVFHATGVRVRRLPVKIEDLI